MFCIKCGKEINEGNAFCIYCGTPVKKTDSQNAKPNNSQGNPSGRKDIRARSAINNNKRSEDKKREDRSSRGNAAAKSTQKRPAAPENRNRQANSNGSSGKKSGKGLIIALIIIIAAAAAALIFLWVNYLNPDRPSSNDNSTRIESEEKSEKEKDTKKEKEEESVEESRAESEKDKTSEDSRTESGSEESSSISEISESSENSEEIPADPTAEAARDYLSVYTVSSAAADLLTEGSNEAEVAQRLKKGDTLEVIQYECGGYWKVRYNNEEFYVNPTALEYSEGDEPESRGSLYAVGDGDSSVKMYSEPKADESSVLAYIESGEEVEFYDLTENAFCLVAYGGDFGFIEEKYLKYSYVSPTPEAATPTATPAPTAAPAAQTVTPAPAATAAPSQNGYGTFTVSYTSDYVTLRSSASLSGNSLIRVNLNEKVYVYELASNGYYRVNYNGTDGYMLASYLVPDSGSTEPGTGTAMTVQGDYLTLRYWPSNSTQEGDEIFRINGGEQVEYIQSAEYGFYLVRYNGRLGFVMSAYLK